MDSVSYVISVILDQPSNPRLALDVQAKAQALEVLNVTNFSAKSLAIPKLFRN